MTVGTDVPREATGPWAGAAGGGGLVCSQGGLPGAGDARCTGTFMAAASTQHHAHLLGQGPRLRSAAP